MILPTAGSQYIDGENIVFSWCGFPADDYLTLYITDNCASPTMVVVGSFLYNPSMCGVLHLQRVQGCPGCCPPPNPSGFGPGAACADVDPECSPLNCATDTGCFRFLSAIGPFVNSCNMQLFLVGQSTTYIALGALWEFVDGLGNCVVC